MEPLSILDLNIDCIFNVLLYLPLMERLKFAYACDDYDYVIITFLRFNTFAVSDCRCYLTMSETEQILSRFGPHIKRLSLDDPIDSVNIKVYRLIADHCCDIETIELHYPARIEYESYVSLVYRILSNANQIESVKIERKVFTDDWPNPWYYRVLEEKLCEMISNLGNLKKLHLTHFFKASGKFLNKLKNLKDLNIEYCINFKSDHFISLCHAIKLKSLNIDNCTFLNDETLEALVETQTELERLTLNTEFDTRNFGIIGRLQSLKELVVYDYYGGRTFDKLLAEIVKHHHKDFKVLKIFTNAANTVENHRIFQERLLALKNISVLCLPYECLNDGYILGIGMGLLKLERLRFNIEERCVHGKDNRMGRIEIARLQRKLLPTNSDFTFTVDLLRPIVEARREANCKQLIICLDIDHIAESLYKSKDYTENFDVLRIEAVF